MTTDLTFGKIPPQARDLEEVVLGACLLEEPAVLTAVSILKPNHFYVTGHQHIFSAMVRLFSKNEPVDILTVVEDLKKNGMIEDVGGPFYVTGLANRIASAAHVEKHARIIKEKWVQRERIRIASNQIKDAYEDSTDCLEGLGDCMNQFSDLLNEVSAGASKMFSDVVDRTFKTITTAASKSDDEKHVIGLTTGNNELDRKTMGFHNSNLVLIAGRNSDGKTSLALAGLLENAKQNIPVGLFSLEMTQDEVVQKMIGIETGMDTERVRSGRVHNSEWDMLDRTREMLINLPVYICDKGAIDIAELSAIAKGWKAKFGVRLFIIDYLQLMSFENKKLTPEQRVSYISRGLKALAKDLNSPVIAISSLSRNLENRSGWDKRPKDADLREGGSLEYDADMIVFVFRPENHQIESYDNGATTRGVVELIISKNRLGSRGLIKQCVNDGTGKLSQYHDRVAPKGEYVGAFDETPF